MAADTVISGVIRGVLPYAAIAAAGFAGYTYLRKKGVLKDAGAVVDSVFRLPEKIVKAVDSVPVPRIVKDNPIIPTPEPENITYQDTGGSTPLVLVESEPTAAEKAYSAVWDGAASQVERTQSAVNAAKSGDWTKAAQQFARNIPGVYVTEKGYNRIKSLLGL